jgi:hypothetical protein
VDAAQVRWQIGPLEVSIVYKTLIFLTLLTFALASCMTTYEPRPSPRLAMIMESGNPLLVRDGRRFHLGLFGGELEEAVTPNALAMEHATTFRSQLLGGFALGVAGGIGLGVGIGTLGVATSERQDKAIPLTILISSAVAYLVGLGLIVGAQPHMHDAINVYNDWIDAGMPADATMTE